MLNGAHRSRHDSGRDARRCAFFLQLHTSKRLSGAVHRIIVGVFNYAAEKTNKQTNATTSLEHNQTAHAPPLAACHTTDLIPTTRAKTRIFIIGTARLIFKNKRRPRLFTWARLVTCLSIKFAASKLTKPTRLIESGSAKLQSIITCYQVG